MLRSGGYDRDQRASTIRFCVRSTNAQGVVTNPECNPVAPTQETISDATTLTRGTNNKVQDLTATYAADRLHATSSTGSARKNEMLTGIDLAREEFNNYTLSLPTGVVLNKNVPRTTIGTPNDGTVGRRGAARRRCRRATSSPRRSASTPRT